MINAEYKKGNAAFRPGNEKPHKLAEGKTVGDAEQIGKRQLDLTGRANVSLNSSPQTISQALKLFHSFDSSLIFAPRAQ